MVVKSILMKKIIFVFILFVVLLILKTTPAVAKVSCPSPEMQCQELDAKGGCESPCVRVVTVIGGKGPSWCQCQKLVNPPGSVACGGKCQIPGDCVTECPYCRANGPGTSMTCSKSTGGGGDTNQPLNLEQIQTGAFPTGTYGVGTSIGKIISDILPYIFTITGILLLIYLLAGGFQLMFAAGDPKKVQGAWGKITNAVIGFVIIFIAYWVTQLIGKVFDISIINAIFK